MTHGPASGGLAVLVRELVHRYGTARKAVSVFDGLDIDVEAGGYLAVTGSSGSGKSTLLSLLGGLQPVQLGSITVGACVVSDLRGDALARYRRQTVGFVFQHFGLMEALSALENVALPAALERIGRSERLARAASLLAAVELSHRLDHLPRQLSGGERQRVAIARALVNRPRLVLADEPTGNLDDDSASVVIGLLERSVVERGATLIVVTHNAALARRASQHLHLERTIGRRDDAVA